MSTSVVNLSADILLIVGYLNEDFTGGETFFDLQDLKVKPQ
jgi:hypothetical protein